MQKAMGVTVDGRMALPLDNAILAWPKYTALNNSRQPMAEHTTARMQCERQCLTACRVPALACRLASLRST